MENKNIPHNCIFGQLKFDLSIIQSTVDYIRIDDKVSLIFLLFDDSSDALSLLPLIVETSEQISKPVFTEILVVWAKNYGPSWRSKFVEALMIIKSFYIINNILDLDCINIAKKYPVDNFQTVFIHPMKKCLYKISEAFTQEETKNFISTLVSIFHPLPFETEGMDSDFFEIFILKLNHFGLIELSTWKTEPASEFPSRKVDVNCLTSTLKNLQLMAVHDLLIEMERQVNESNHIKSSLEFRESPRVFAARLAFDSWTLQGLNVAIAKLHTSVYNPAAGISPAQNLSDSEEYFDAQSSIDEEIVNEPRQPSEVHSNETIIRHPVDLLEISEQSLARVSHVPQADLMDIAEELESIHLHEMAGLRPIQNESDSEEYFDAQSSIFVDIVNEPRQPSEEHCNETIRRHSVELLEISNQSLAAVSDETRADYTDIESINLIKNKQEPTDKCYPINRRIYFMNNNFIYENDQEPVHIEGLEERMHAVADEDCVTEIFKSLNFDTEAVLLNLEHDSIEYVIDNWVMPKNPSIFVFVMISYGLHGQILSSDCKLLSREFITGLLVKFPGLVGIPKIVILQTYMLDDMTLSDTLPLVNNELEDLFFLWVHIPRQMHFVDGNLNNPKVSMFVSTFCDYIKAMDQSKDFVSACVDICSQLEAATNGMVVPQCVSSLTKLIYLKQ